MIKQVNSKPNKPIGQANMEDLTDQTRACLVGINGSCNGMIIYVEQLFSRLVAFSLQKIVIPKKFHRNRYSSLKGL